MGPRRTQNSKALQNSNSEETPWRLPAPTTTTLGRVLSLYAWLPASQHLIPGSASRIWRSLPCINLQDVFHLFRNCSDNIVSAPTRVFKGIQNLPSSTFPHQISLHPLISLTFTCLSGLHYPPGILSDAIFDMSIPWNLPHFQDPLKPLLISPWRPESSKFKHFIKYSLYFKVFYFFSPSKF